MQAPGTMIPGSAPCGEYGTYTITIHNEAKELDIFPVLVTSTNAADEWLQAAFQVPRTKIGQVTYAHKFQYRMYVKPRVGIAPGQHVVLTLPLWSQLAAAPDGTKPDEYIDWWNGGRLHIYASHVSGGAPPVLTRNFEIDQPNVVTPLTPGPACAGCPLPNPPIFKNPAPLPIGDTALLMEYTLGAIDRGETYKIVSDFKIVDCSSYPGSTRPAAGIALIDDPASEFRVVIG